MHFRTFQPETVEVKKLESKRTKQLQRGRKTAKIHLNAKELFTSSICFIKLGGNRSVKAVRLFKTEFHASCRNVYFSLI